MASVYGGDGQDDDRRRGMRRRRSARDFSYDVSVNVLANLVAAGIVALILQAFGVIRLNRGLIVFIGVVLCVVMALLFGFLNVIQLLDRYVPSLSRAQRVILGAVIVFGLIAVGWITGRATPPYLSPVGVIAGVIVSSFMLALLYLIGRSSPKKPSNRNSAPDL